MQSTRIVSAVHLIIGDRVCLPEGALIQTDKHGYLVVLSAPTLQQMESLTPMRDEPADEYNVEYDENAQATAVIQQQMEDDVRMKTPPRPQRTICKALPQNQNVVQYLQCLHNIPPAQQNPIVALPKLDPNTITSAQYQNLLETKETYRAQEKKRKGIEL